MPLPAAPPPRTWSATATTISSTPKPSSRYNGGKISGLVERGDLRCLGQYQRHRRRRHRACPHQRRQIFRPHEHRRLRPTRHTINIVQLDPKIERLSRSRGRRPASLDVDALVRAALARLDWLNRNAKAAKALAFCFERVRVRQSELLGRRLWPCPPATWLNCNRPDKVFALMRRIQSAGAPRSGSRRASDALRRNAQ